MSSRIPPRHAFLSAYRYLSTLEVCLEFADGRKYLVENVSSAAWLGFKADSHRGKNWNEKNALLYAGMSPTRELHEVPAGWTDAWP